MKAHELDKDNDKSKQWLVWMAKVLILNIIVRVCVSAGDRIRIECRNAGQKCSLLIAAILYYFYHSFIVCHTLF